MEKREFPGSLAVHVCRLVVYRWKLLLETTATEFFYLVMKRWLLSLGSAAVSAAYYYWFRQNDKGSSHFLYSNPGLYPRQQTHFSSDDIGWLLVVGGALGVAYWFTSRQESDSSSRNFSNPRLDSRPSLDYSHPESVECVSRRRKRTSFSLEKCLGLSCMKLQV